MNNVNFPMFKAFFYGLGLQTRMDGNDERESKKMSSVKKNAGNLKRYHKNKYLEARSIIKFRKLNNKGRDLFVVVLEYGGLRTYESPA